MKVPNLGNRVFEIYLLTCLLGSLTLSFFLCLSEYNFSMFVPAIIGSTLASLLLCIPNAIILNIGIRYVYKKPASTAELNFSYLYLWFANISFIAFGLIFFIILDLNYVAM